MREQEIIKIRIDGCTALSKFDERRIATKLIWQVCRILVLFWLIQLVKPFCIFFIIRKFLFSPITNLQSLLLSSFTCSSNFISLFHFHYSIYSLTKFQIELVNLNLIFLDAERIEKINEFCKLIITIDLILLKGNFSFYFSKQGKEKIILLNFKKKKQSDKFTY